MGFVLAIIFTVLALLSGYWGTDINNKKLQDIETPKEVNTATTYGQQGGVTAGKIDNLTVIEGDVIQDDAPRILSLETLEAMKPALETAPPRDAEIIVSLEDADSYGLGQQIRTVLLEHGWNIQELKHVTVMNPMLGRGITMYYGETLSPATLLIFTPIFDQFGYLPKIGLDDNLQGDSIRIYIGPR